MCKKIMKRLNDFAYYNYKKKNLDRGSDIFRKKHPCEWQSKFFRLNLECIELWATVHPYDYT